MVFLTSKQALGLLFGMFGPATPSSAGPSEISKSLTLS